jgi:hypothetical protein
MPNILAGAAVLLMSIVITQADIREAIPAGTSEAEAVMYLKDISGSDSLEFFTREDNRRGTVSHQLVEGERGYYIVRLDRVRPRWWQPSLGASLRIIVVISSSGNVSKVDFHSAVSGWP